MLRFRRFFLPFASALLCLLQSTTHAAEFRAWWVDTWSPAMMNADEISQLVRDARAAHFNSLLVEVRRRGDAFYNSKFEPKAAGVAADFDPLADLIAKAHDTNSGPRLQVHCWIVTYPVFQGKYPPPQSNHPLNLHPDWMNRTITGAITENENYYYDPGHPSVQKHIFNVAMDLVTHYDIDGLNWDYIRYPGTQWGYNPVSIARFNSRFGRTGQPAKNDPDWLQFRRDQVTALVRKVYLSAIALKPQLILSADTFAVRPNSNKENPWLGSDAYGHVLQEWRAWMEEGILDLNVPMTYMDQATHGSDYLFSSSFTKNHRYHRFALIGPSLYDNTISNSIVQIRQTRDATAEGNHADGVACFSYAAYTKEHRRRSELIEALTHPGPDDSIRSSVFSNSELPPDMPWKTTPLNGHLNGVINDDATNIIDGASIKIVGPVTRTALSDATGFYGTADLPPGRYTVTASFPGMAAASKTISISAGAVTDADLSLMPSSLAIALHPQDQSVAFGTNAVLNVHAVGLKPMHLQWLCNGMPMIGATNESLRFIHFALTNAGDYQVIASNSSGSITSAMAKVRCEFVLRTNVVGNGSIWLAPNRLSYPAKSSVIVAARPATGFDFSGWSGDIALSNSVLTLTMSNNVSLTAHFVKSKRDLIVDNRDATFTGIWNTATASSDRYGPDYKFAATTAGAATATATYRPLITEPGNYDVFVWYTAGGNRSSKAQFVISSSNEVTTALVDQTTTGGSWRKIVTGKYFEAGTNSFVRLRNNTGETDRHVMADAVRFLWSPNQQLSAEKADLSEARQKDSVLLASFETNKLGSSVLLHPSGLTDEFMDKQHRPSSRVVSTPPTGNSSSNALLVNCEFSANRGTNAWLRLTTTDDPVVPNPTISFDKTVAFAVYANRPVHIALGLRETEMNAAPGANGGNEGPIEWIGGTTDNSTRPPKGHFVPAGRWVWLEFVIPNEPVCPFTGNGTLDSLTGKAVFEEIAVVPADGAGAYNLYFDNFWLIPSGR